MANWKVTGNLEIGGKIAGGGRTELLKSIFPVGSIYLSVSEANPSTFLGIGTWEKLSAGHALWTASNGAGGTIAAGLPNITGSFKASSYSTTGDKSGAFTVGGSTDCPKGSNNGGFVFSFSAKNSNSIYGNSTTVQPPAIKIYAWKRVS